MNTGFESVKKEIAFVSELHTKQNAEKAVHGRRIHFPSDGTMLEAILYYRDSNCPTIATAFGGGFVLGGCALDDRMWTDLSETLQVNIFSIGYRKTPVYQFPTALNDVYNGVCWLWENAGELEICPDKIAVMGASAGGNLAAGAAILDTINGTHHIKAQILNYPYLDLATDPAEKGHPEDEYNMYRLFPELYVPEEERKNPLASPVYAAGELTGLPLAYITVAGSDTLRREGTLYAEKLRAAGVKTELAIAQDMPHGYLESWYNLTDPEQEQDTGFFPGNLLELYRDGALRREAEKTRDFIMKAINDTFGK